jgi:hypothetical protein
MIRANWSLVNGFRIEPSGEDARSTSVNSVSETHIFRSSIIPAFKLSMLLNVTKLFIAHGNTFNPFALSGALANY